MAHRHGLFTWYELMTSDLAGAQTFYGAVAQWTMRDSGAQGMTYILASAGSTPVAGLMTLPEHLVAKSVAPHWLGYVGVDDVDATVAEVLRLGGSVHAPADDIPDVGRYAVVADPQGATFGVMKWIETMAGPQPDQMAVGQTGWHELMAADWEGVFPFYNGLFGWEKGTAVDMGPMGVYQLFTIDGKDIGGMFTKPADVPVPFWLYYTNVDDIDAAVQRVLSGGGQVLNGPMAVPGGTWIIQAMDPQGAMFALVGPKTIG
ncbi:VOC family protein [Azorhizobium sp. AG788]|uniref:VOC family protein n=1 Tax=Azorhizobium sp. AG788 TaxID=2183897 RepID=UPI0031397C41